MSFDVHFGIDKFLSRPFLIHVFLSDDPLPIRQQWIQNALKSCDQPARVQAANVTIDNHPAIRLAFDNLQDYATFVRCNYAHLHGKDLFKAAIDLSSYGPEVTESYVATTAIHLRTLNISHRLEHDHAKRRMVIICDRFVDFAVFHNLLHSETLERSAISLANAKYLRNELNRPAAQPPQAGPQSPQP